MLQLAETCDMTKTLRNRAKLDALQDIRRDVLKAILVSWFDGNQSALSRELGVTASYVNRIFGPERHRKRIGEGKAREFETALQIPQGSLDSPISGPLGPRTRSAFGGRGKMLSQRSLELVDAWESLPEVVRTEFERLILAVAEEQKPQVPEAANKEKRKAKMQ